MPVREKAAKSNRDLLERTERDVVGDADSCLRRSSVLSSSASPPNSTRRFDVPCTRFDLVTAHGGNVAGGATVQCDRLFGKLDVSGVIPWIGASAYGWSVLAGR